MPVAILYDIVSQPVYLRLDITKISKPEDIHIAI